MQLARIGGSFADTIDVVPIGAWYGNGRKAKAGYLSPVLLAVYDEEDGVFRSISRCMSFSDSMYTAMRNFYFDGIPYPDAVNKEAPTSSDADVDGSGATNEISDDDENAGESADSDVEEINEFASTGTAALSSTDEENASKMVNCFPGRPPSSVVLTNENPPIWFRPMEVFEVSFADLTLSRAHMAAAGLIVDQEGRGVALRFPRFKRRRPDKKPDQATTAEQIAHMFYQQSKTRRPNST